MSKQADATPRPWLASGSYSIEDANGRFVLATLDSSRSDAEDAALRDLIVRAVNAHEALSDLAHRIVEAFEHGGDWAVVDAPLATAARAALKLAEGKP